jgi:hypothetical protein
VRLSALGAGRHLPPGRLLALISVRGWVDPRAIVLVVGLGKLKNPMTSSEIEPATFGLHSASTNYATAMAVSQIKYSCMVTLYATCYLKFGLLSWEVLYNNIQHYLEHVWYKPTIQQTTNLPQFLYERDLQWNVETTDGRATSNSVPVVFCKFKVPRQFPTLRNQSASNDIGAQCALWCAWKVI